MDFTREVAHCKTESLTRRFIGSWRQRNFGGGIDVGTRVKLVFPIGLRGEFRDFYTLGNPSFGVPVLRSDQHNLVVSGGLVVHFWRASAWTVP